MSATSYSCSACEELKQEVPELICNGFDDEMCASLQNDTGLSPSSGHNDCTDLNNLNDCLVGNEESEVDLYEVCDWKPFMKQFIGNLWTTLKAMICAICGIWTNIHNLWNKIAEILQSLQQLNDITDRINCLIDYMYQGDTFYFGELSQGLHSYIVAGKGVSFLNVGETGLSADVSITYVGGGLARITGSCKFYKSSFSEPGGCYSYDGRGVDPTWSGGSRSGNANWDGSNKKPGGSGSELVYEIRVYHPEFPKIGYFFSGIALNAEGGGFHCTVHQFPAGKYAYGQHGRCDENSGVPGQSGYDHGHLVPQGWTYIQMRVTWIEKMDANGNQYSPNGLLGIRMNPNAITC